MVDLREIEKTMVGMAYKQHHLNTITSGPNWMSLRHDWLRAVWVECAEFMQHYGGWEWWKKKDHTPESLFQCKLELVDIFHFGLSYLIEYGNSVEDASRWVMQVFPAFRPEHSSADPINLVEGVAMSALDGGGFGSYKLFMAWYALDKEGFDSFARLYMAKCILNDFRQISGYREGLYIKTWEGKEDNCHLQDVLQEVPSIPVMSDEFAWMVKSRLGQRYKQIMRGNSAT